MTIGGMNLRIRVWRINYDPDNEVGGAVTTGTVVGNYPARLQQEKEQQLLLQQGLETNRTFTMTVIPGNADIRERDEVDICLPQDHVYYGQRFRVRGVTYASHNPRDPRNYMILSLSRSVRSHVRQ